MNDNSKDKRVNATGCEDGLLQPTANREFDDLADRTSQVIAVAEVSVDVRGDGPMDRS